MALFIDYLEPLAGTKQVVARTMEWHVGEKIPDILPSRILELQADGHELECIGLRFIKDFGTPEFMPTIPWNLQNGRSQRWYGDIARTIFMNLG